MIVVVGLLIIAVLTLTPDFGAGHQEPSLCVICGERGGEDALLNILLFIPFGFGLRLRGTNGWWAWLLATAVTATVETLQINIPGRDATLGDVVMNSSGAAIGIFLCDTWPTLLFPNRREAKWLLFASSILWLALVALGGWAMRPSIPSGPYSAQVAPDLEDIELFVGRVLAAQLDGAPIIPSAQLANSGAIRDSILRGTVTIEARILPAAPTFGLAPIVSISSARESELLVLGQDWRDAVLRVRLHSGELRMNVPDVTATRVLPSGSRSQLAGLRTDTFDLRGEIRAGRQLKIIAASREGRTVAELSLNPFLLWSLATLGERRSPRAFKIFSMLWVAVLLAPLGYWAGRWKLHSDRLNQTRARQWTPEIVLVASGVAGLAVIPPIFGFPVATIQLWIDAILTAGTALCVGAHWKSAAEHEKQSS